MLMRTDPVREVDRLGRLRPQGHGIRQLFAGDTLDTDRIDALPGAGVADVADADR